jgi:hypothetical protein
MQHKTGKSVGPQRKMQSSSVSPAERDSGTGCFYIVRTVYVPTESDVCQQPTHTHNSMTINIQVFIYPDMFQRITASSSGGACFKNTKTPVKTLKAFVLRRTKSTLG